LGNIHNAGDGKDLLWEDQVLGAGEEHVREAPPARIDFSFYFLMFLPLPEIQAD
jgi:hypothetical protein